MKRITLANLHEAMKQEVFNQVAIHLLTQNERSITQDPDGSESCQYRGANGLSCAAGCLMSDAEYLEILGNYNIEGSSWDGVIAKTRLDFAKASAHIDLIVRLQAIHDNWGSEVKTGTSEWKGRLESLALSQGLTMPEVPACA